MNPKPTFQTLPLECLLEVLSYVPLPECMFLRSSCSHLKNTVDEHFRFKVRALPVMLTARYSFRKSTEYEKVFEERKEEYNLTEYEKITFGSTSGVSHMTIWENKDIFETHFRFENCLLLFSWGKFDKFVKFIAKYMPNITKLELLIDAISYLDRVPVILSLYRKQLKVLLMKRTTRLGAAIHSDPEFAFNPKEFELPDEIYQSVGSLDALEKLYYFSRSMSDLDYGDIGTLGHQLVERMLRKLQVLHIGSEMLVASDFRFWSKVYRNLQELACDDHCIFHENTAIFPRLEKLILNCGQNEELNLLSPESLPNLKKFVIPNLRITQELMQKLNSFPSLRHVFCSHLHFEDGEDYTNIEPNRTLKVLEIDDLADSVDIAANLRPDLVKHLTNVLMAIIKRVLPLFPALEKIVIREPPIELKKTDFDYIKAYFSFLN